MNNRIYKFRCWNKKEKKMSNDFTLFELATPFSKKGFTLVMEKDDLEIIQFTGLKDQDGKEIYEGDIIKFLDSFPAGAIMINLDGTRKNIDSATEAEMKIGKIENFGSHYYVSGKGSGRPLSLAMWNCEVIGNIYENPELLK